MGLPHLCTCLPSISPWKRGGRRIPYPFQSQHHSQDPARGPGENSHLPRDRASGPSDPSQRDPSGFLRCTLQALRLARKRQLPCPCTQGVARGRRSRHRAWPSKACSFPRRSWPTESPTTRNKTSISPCRNRSVIFNLFAARSAVPAQGSEESRMGSIQESSTWPPCSCATSLACLALSSTPFSDP